MGSKICLGFTLFEVLVACFLLSLIIGVTFSAISETNHYLKKVREFKSIDGNIKDEFLQLNYLITRGPNNFSDNFDTEEDELIVQSPEGVEERLPILIIHSKQGPWWCFMPLTLEEQR